MRADFSLIVDGAVCETCIEPCLYLDLDARVRRLGVSFEPPGWAAPSG